VLISRLPHTILGVSGRRRIRHSHGLSAQFSPEGYGVTENLQETLEKLYNRYVEQYYDRPERHSRSDEDIWKVFKKSLEEKRILSNLKPHQIIGNNYDYEFKYCWKNEVWRIQEPVSFDLIEANSITDKANVWLGRIMSLYDGGEPFQMNVLLGAPQDERLKPAFVKAQNIMNRMPYEHEFIKEDEAEDFAGSLRKGIEEHEG